MNNDGKVPQFPGKGGAAQPNKPGPTQELPGWKKAVCPILTAGEIARQSANVIVTPGAQPPPMRAQPCLGPQCMMFIAIKQADGSERAGCAPVQAFGQLVGLNMMVSEFMLAAKAGAEEEARARAAVPDAVPPTEIPEPSPLTAAADAAVKPE